MRLVKVLHYDDDSYRRLLYRTLILDRDQVDEEGVEVEQFGKLTFPVDALRDDEFLLELCREYQIKKNAKWSWEHEPGNDFGDAVKMSVIGRDVWCRSAVRD